MDSFSEIGLQIWENELRSSWVMAAIVLIIGWFAGRAAGNVVRGILGDRVSAHQALLARRAVAYGVFFVFATSALHTLGFQLSVLLGAAGVLTVAIGFAAQTSAANLVSGLFLLAEHPFGIGDVIKVAETTGEVISIDLLSVKLRTYDNLLVRIPNESLIKSQLTNLTQFPVRRLDLKFGVSYAADLERVHEVLAKVADHNPLSLEEPAPLFIILGFGESGVDIQFSLWAVRERFLELRNSVQIEIKRAFDAEGIEIPYPHRTITAGNTNPFPLELASTGDGQTGSA